MPIGGFLNETSGGFNISQGAATVLAGILRRLMEKKYDDLAEMGFFKKLKSQDAATKKAIELMLNSLTAVLDQSMNEDSFIKKLLKEVAMDAPAEISKRLINGGKTAKNPIDREVIIPALLEMDKENPKALREFLEWINSVDSAKKQKMLEALQGFSADNALAMLKLQPEVLEGLLALFEKPETTKTTSSIDEMLSLIVGRLEEYVAKKKGKSK